MKFIVTLHIPADENKDTPETWQYLVKHALESIACVHGVEVEAEHIGGSGDQ